MKRAIYVTDDRQELVPWDAIVAPPDGSAFTFVDDDNGRYWCVFLNGLETFRSRLFTDGIEAIRSLKEAADNNPRIDTSHVGSALAYLAEHEEEELRDKTLLETYGVRRKRVAAREFRETTLPIPAYAKWARIINHSARPVTIRIAGEHPVTIEANPTRTDDEPFDPESLKHQVFHRPDGFASVTAVSEGSLLVVDWSPDLPRRMDLQ